MILTVRDSDEKWYKSWISFNESNIKNNIGRSDSYPVLLYLMEYGWMGNAMKKMVHNCTFVSK